MIGNIYFVGTVETSSHLIDTGDGLILLDTGYEETADIIVESMSALGFDIKDVKIIIHSHGHSDHTDGTAKLLRLAPEAKTYLSFHDKKYIKGFSPDFDICDGDVIALGNTKITCLFTPGHTEGTASFFLDVVEDGKTYRAAMFGGAGVKQLKKGFMDEREVPYRCRGLFFDSVERLLKEKVDVMIGNHSWLNHTVEKREKMKDAEQNPFIDPSEWEGHLKRVHAGLWRAIRADSREKFVVYANRGAVEEYPENTASAFCEAVRLGANGLKTDIQKTKDGVLVLFQDDTLERLTGGQGRVCDYTYEELQNFSVKRGERKDKILSLAPFLEQFSGNELVFSLELKADGIEKETVDLVGKYGLAKRTVITSFSLARLQKVKGYAPHIRVGYLTEADDSETVDALLTAGADEICPRANTVTAEAVDRWHRIGMNICVWGVVNEEQMKAVYEAGADAMAVNTPEVLREYIENTNK